MLPLVSGSVHNSMHETNDTIIRCDPRFNMMGGTILTKGTLHLGCNFKREQWDFYNDNIVLRNGNKNVGFTQMPLKSPLGEFCFKLAISGRIW